MSESLIHYNYVKKIFKYVLGMIEPEESCLIRADLFEYEKPNLIYDEYIPDVMFRNNKKLIIGEAKTLEDYKTEHSYCQYKAYFKECSMFPGESTIIICVPWQLYISAKNHFKLLKKISSPKTTIIVLSDVGMEDKI